MQHTGFFVFGKHPMLSGDRDQVRRQLDRKKQATGLLDLYTKLRQAQSFYGSAPSLDASLEVEELFRKGEKLGIWSGQGSDKKIGPAPGTPSKVGAGSSSVGWGSSSSGWGSSSFSSGSSGKASGW